MRFRKFRVASLSLALVSFAVFPACSYEGKAARIIQASLTYAPFESESGERGTLPSEMKCGDKTVKVDGGTLSLTSLAQSGDSVSFDLDMEAGIPAETDSSGQSTGGGKFTCKVKLKYKAESTETSLTLSGQGEITSCTGFECTYKKTELDCEKLKEAMADACT